MSAAPRKTKKGEEPFSTSLPSDLRAKLKAEAERRGVPVKLLLQSAIEAFLKGPQPTDFELLLSRLHRQHGKKLIELEALLKLQVETQYRFVEQWFVYASDIEDESLDAQTEKGKAKFRSFQESLLATLEQGNGVLQRKRVLLPDMADNGHDFGEDESV